MAWTDAEAQRIGDSAELNLASARSDGTLSPFVTMWVVSVESEVYVRSAGGPERPWYRRAMAQGTGRIRAGGIDRDVTFARASADAHDSIDAAYHTKYDSYGENIVSHVTGPNAQPVTVRLVPQAGGHRAR